MSKPESYGPDPALLGFWAVLASFPAIATAFVAFQSTSHVTVNEFAWTLAPPVLLVLFTSRFRATFAATEFIYRRWGPTIRVPYSNIERIEIANVTPITSQAIGAFLITTRGERLPFWPKLFPQAAVERFFGLAS